MFIDDNTKEKGKLSLFICWRFRIVYLGLVWLICYWHTLGEYLSIGPNNFIKNVIISNDVGPLFLFIYFVITVFTDYFTKR